MLNYRSRSTHRHYIDIDIYIYIYGWVWLMRALSVIQYFSTYKDIWTQP